MRILTTIVSQGAVFFTVFKRKNISSDGNGAPAPAAASEAQAAPAPASASDAAGTPASVAPGSEDAAATAPASSPAPADTDAASPTSASASDAAGPDAAADTASSGDAASADAASDADASADATPPKKKKHVSISNILIALVLIAGIGIFCYPAVSDWWNSMHASRAIASYQEVVAALTEEEKAAIVAQAREYNAQLDALPDRFSGAPSINGAYEQALNVTGDGLIGFVTVEKIDVRLPIYHGTEEGTLQTSAGHLEGSHLPTGDVGTHPVVSAHRGLPSAILFTYLDEVHEGDYFSITVLDNEMFYQVDQVLIVEPGQLEALASEDGTEYATLQTCTPYGINTHRLLVRGHRVDGIPDNLGDMRDARRVPIHIMAPAVAVPILLIALIGLLIATRRKPAHVTEDDLRAVSIAPDGLLSGGGHHAPDAPDDSAEPDALGEPATTSDVDGLRAERADVDDADADNPDARREHDES